MVLPLLIVIPISLGTVPLPPPCVLPHTTVELAVMVAVCVNVSKLGFVDPDVHTVASFKSFSIV